MGRGHRAGAPGSACRPHSSGGGGERRRGGPRPGEGPYRSGRGRPRVPPNGPAGRRRAAAHRGPGARRRPSRGRGGERRSRRARGDAGQGPGARRGARRVPDRDPSGPLLREGARAQALPLVRPRTLRPVVRGGRGRLPARLRALDRRSEPGCVPRPPGERSRPGRAPGDTQVSVCAGRGRLRADHEGWPDRGPGRGAGISHGG